MGEDLFESFIRYQQRVITELDGLSREYEFYSIDATGDVDEISEDLCNRVSALLRAGDSVLSSP